MWQILAEVSFENRKPAPPIMSPFNENPEDASSPLDLSQWMLTAYNNAHEDSSVTALCGEDSRSSKQKYF